MNLLDILRAYPGGVAQLSRDSGVPQHTLYRLGHRSHRRTPVRVLDQIAAAFQGKRILGRTYDAPALVDVWKAQPVEERAS